MVQALRRRGAVYSAFAAMVPKMMMAYSIWFWMELVVQLLSMIIFVFFWRAVYANGDVIGGLTLQQTLTYILLAQILVPLVQNSLIFDFGFLLREGGMAIELVRPVDLQFRMYVEQLALLALYLVQKLPLAIVAWLAFGMQLPGDAAVWATFAISLFLGHAVLFFFDWLFACLAFYSTETWGLSVVRFGIATFFSGALVPLSMMPDWLQMTTRWLPFAQGIYYPVSFLSGITPLSDAPAILLGQVLWLVAASILSRLVFRVAVRTVTVQGG